MAKPKIDLKAFLLQRGEMVAMGAAGFCLVVLLIVGMSKRTSAEDPTKTADDLKRKSNAVYAAIENGKAEDADTKQLEQPAWVKTGNVFPTLKEKAFAQSGPLFDPTAQPNTKRENPAVLGIGDYQVDLTRAAMLGYDMYFDPATGEPFIAVLTTTAKNTYDADKVKKAAADLAAAAARGKAAQGRLGGGNRPQNPPQNPAPGPGGGPPGPGGGPPGPGGGPPGPGGGPRGPGGLGNPHGFGGGEFDQSGKRDEKAIKYIPLAEIDEAVKKGNLPAFTIIPLRLVTVHAVVPYKKQLDELKRALRLPTPPANATKAEIEKAEADARQWGPWYDGYEVQRRVTRLLPNGTLLVIQDWPEKPQDPKDTSGNYKFEELYIEKIDSKKIADHFDEGYIPYFLKPEMMLAMPLPQLAKDLKVKYPEVKLKDILDNIEKLKKSNQKELSQSDLAKRLSGSKPKNDLYKSKTSDAVEGFGYNPKDFGPTSGGAPPGGAPAPGMPPMPPGGGPGPPPGGPGPGGGLGSPKFPDGHGPNSGAAVGMDIDNFLLRFVDCDVKPGFTYEYRIRLRMQNPNFGQDKHVSNPEYAKESYKVLYSKWTPLLDKITVPAESFLYAHDVQAYRNQVNAAYPVDGKDASAETKAVNSLLQVKDHQAVVQVATWMEQVKAGEGAKREPVGAWVVAEMPVGRGEYVGRKQIIKLPLWSSETQLYGLREVADKVVKGKYQPKGWLVNFSTESVLVDFEGGKVKSKTNVKFDERGTVVPGTRTIEEDVATEMLIVRADGKLIVRSSLADDLDQNRKSITTEWTRWVDEVSKRKAPASSGAGEPNPFDPPKKP